MVFVFFCIYKYGEIEENNNLNYLLIAMLSALGPVLIPVLIFYRKNKNNK